MEGELPFIIMSSLLIGFNIALGIYFVISPHNTKPFRLIFALECFVLAVQELLNLFEPTISMHLGGRDLSLLSIAKDLTLIPLCYIEVEALVRQDLQKYTWRERTKKLLIHEIPFFVLMVLSFYWPLQLTTLLVYWFGLGYTLACAVILNGMIMSYERQMRELYGPKSAYSLRWIYVIMVLLIAFAILFVGFSLTNRREDFMYIYMYSPCVVIIMLTHAYFIENQRIPNNMIARPRKDVDSLGF